MIYRDEETYQFFENQDNPNEKSEFEFKDSYWDEMESMLDAQDSKKRKRRSAFIWFSSAAAIVVAFIGLYKLDGILYPNSKQSDLLIMNLDQSSVLNNVSKNTQSKAALDNKVALLQDKNDILEFSKTNDKKSNRRNLKNLNEPVQLISKKSVSRRSIEKLNAGIQFAANLENHQEVLDRMTIADEAIYAESIATEEISQEATNQINLEERKIKFPLKHSLYAVFEAGIVNKYQPEKGVSYGLLAGLGYELGFHKNLSFQTGVNIQYREGLNQFYRNEAKVYGYHSVRYYQDITYKGQINVEIPLALKIKMKRSSITAGVAPSFLITTRSTVNQFTRENPSVENVKNNFGIRDGIRNMDVNLNLSYAYAVSSNLELSAGVSAGLLDQTDNEFFNNDHKDHNLQFRLGLKYFFFNK